MLVHVHEHIHVHCHVYQKLAVFRVHEWSVHKGFPLSVLIEINITHHEPNNAWTIYS